MIRRPPRSTRTDTLFPYTTPFRSDGAEVIGRLCERGGGFVDDLEIAGGIGRQKCAGLIQIEVQLREQRARILVLVVRADDVGQRSEEHTSELQSLMRISYAVFCLKKKKKEQAH